MRKLFLPVLFALALAVPAQASANAVAMEPSGPTAEAMGEAIVADPSQLTAASLPEWPFSPEPLEVPWPVGIGYDEVSPTSITGFPTAGNSFGILSNGDVHTIADLTANEDEGTTTEYEEQTSVADRGTQANDWTTLKLDVAVPAGDNCLALDYRFLSEEFPEFVGSEFNDAFIAEIDSSSWSVGEGGELARSNDFASSPEATPISVNGVGPTAVTPEEAEGTYFDAATGLITTKAPITAGAHSIYLSIFDASDKALDSAVFLDNLRFVNEDPSTCRPPNSAELQAPPAGSPPPPPAPSNQFTIGPKVKFKTGGTKATITVNVPGPGTLSATQQSAAASASAGRAAASGVTELKAKGKKKASIVPTSVKATAAGPVTVTIKLTGPAKKVLAKKRKLTVSVALTFTPTGGSPATQVKTLTFKKPAKKGKPKKHAKG
jgi:hypothetical protein